MLMMIFAFVVAPIAIATATSDSFVSNLPSYTIYATCSDTLALKQEKTHNDPYGFNYDSGNYYGDSFIGVYYAAPEYADVYIRSEQKLSFSYSLYVADYILYGVDQNDDFLAIGGSIGDYTPSSLPGNVFIYSISDSGRWSEYSTLVTPSGASYFFGHAIAMTDTLLAVGDLGADNGGAIYMYELISGDWTFMSTLNTNYGGLLGSGVALSGNEVITTINTANVDPVADEMYVFLYDSGVWTFKYTISGGPYSVVPSGYSHMPVRLQIQENLLLLSQHVYDDSNNDQYFKEYLFANRSGVWTYESEILPGNADASKYGIGWANYVSGNTLLVMSCFDAWEYTLGPYAVPPDTCKTDYSTGGGGSAGDLGLILGVAIGGGGGGLLLIITVWYCYRRRRTNAGKVKPNGDADKIAGFVGGAEMVNKNGPVAAVVPGAAVPTMYV